MPNAAVAQGDATDHFDRWLQPDRKAALLLDIFRLFTESKVYVRQDGGYTSAGARMITDWDLKGIILSETSRNADADGRLWIRITANGANWDIDVYKAKAAGAGNKVLSATNVAAGATITFSAANSSGISGTAKLGSSVAAIAGDTYAVQIWLGFPQMDRQVYDGEHQEDGELLAASAELNAEIADALRGVIDSLNQLAESEPFNKITGRIWKIPPGLGFLDKKPDENDDVISVVVDGVYERLRQNWKDNATVQHVKKTTLAASAVTYESGNLGLGTLTVGTLGENLEPGLVQLTCIEDDLPGATRFRVTFTPDDGSGDVIGARLLTLSKVWDDPDIPVQLTLAPTYTKTGADAQIAPVADIASITGLTKQNSDDGKLYFKIVASGASFIYEFYSDSSRTKLVAKSPAVAAATAFTATQQNRSGLSVSWKSGTAPTAGTTGDVDINPFKKSTSTTAADQMRFSVTRSTKGKIQEYQREFHDWKLNSDASPVFADTFVEKSGPFIDGNP